MSIVNHDTGEIIETIGADEARRLTTEAQAEFRSGAAHTARGWELVEQAVRGGGHVDLNYRSPGDYLKAEFDGILSGFNISERRLAVRTMTDWGLSTRAIGSVVGVTHPTVLSDLKTGGKDLPPAPKTATSPTLPPSGEAAPESPVVDAVGVPSAGETSPAGATEAGPATMARRPQVVGIDGKTYNRPAPMRATPRPEAERSLNVIALYAGKAAREAASLTPDQIRRIKPKADLWTVGLRDHVEALQRLLTSLEQEK